MDIGVPLKDLGDYDIEPLRQIILSLQEVNWSAHTCHPQKNDLHSQTDVILMVSTDGSGWPDIELRREGGWDLLVEEAMPLMRRILQDHYPPGGTIIRAMAVRLPAGGAVDSHRDTQPSSHFAHRIHIPLVSNPGVCFMIEDHPCRLEVGRVYEINNQAGHGVTNEGDEACIDFIFDYLPPNHITKDVESNSLSA